MYTITNENWKLFNNQLEYAVNEDKGTVACYFKSNEPQENIWFDILDNMLDTLNSPVDKLYSPHMMFMAIDEYPNKYGLAKCLPEDTFDIEFGKRMARNQLRDRINRCKINFLDKYRDKYMHSKTQYENREANLYNKLVDATENYSKSLVKE